MSGPPPVNTNGSAGGPPGPTPPTNSQPLPPVTSPKLLSANEQAHGVLEQLGYKKASETLRVSILQQKQFERAGQVQGDGTPIESGPPSGSAVGAKREPTASSAPGAQISQQSAQPVRAQPLPVPEASSLDEMLKRNLPQAFSLSSSSIAYPITPEFMQQAENVVAMHLEKVQRSAANASSGAGPAAAVGQIPLLDSVERIKGYVELRKWVERGLDIWKPELREVLFPVFVHTFLDLIETARKAGAEFYATQSPILISSTVPHHARELAALGHVNSPGHVLHDPFVQRFRTQRYTINLSKSSFGLLLGWLSDIGLEALWDVPRDTGRYKEAIRHIVNTRLNVRVSETSMPLNMDEALSQNGFLDEHFDAPGSSLSTFNSKEPIKLGLVQNGQQLTKHAEMKLDDIKREINVEEGEATARASGSGDVEMDNVVNSTDNASPKPDAPEIATAPIPRGSVIGFGPTNSFGSIDLAKEVKSITDARKRIKLGDKAMVAGASAFVRQPSLPSVCCYTIFDGGEGTTATAISEDASYMAAGSSESVIRLWSLKGENLKTREYGYATKIAQGGESTSTEDPGKPVRKLVGHSGPVYSVAFDPIAGSAAAPSHLLSSSQDGTVRLWSTDTFKNLAVYKGHADPVWAVEWGPYGAQFATASRDRTARLWITDRVAPVRMFAGHLSDVDCIKFHPNSLYLATGSSDKTCRLWDIQRGECVRVFMGHDDAVNCIAISPDGRYLASAGQDKSIKLWDLFYGRVIKTMTGHTQPIHSLSFSAESSVIISGSSDCTVRVWDAKTMGGKKTGPGQHDTNQTSDLLTTYYTKRTPITTTHFTPRNLCLVAGAFTEDQT